MHNQCLQAPHDKLNHEAIKIDAAHSTTPLYLTSVKSTKSGLMGFLLDGFPVYGPQEENGTLSLEMHQLIDDIKNFEGEK